MAQSHHTKPARKIKAIETHYNGYRFRSRLEARWAVWLDHLGIKYRYEAEGFDLNGEWYLPDFYLPEHKAWIEIKPTDPTEREINLAELLAKGTKQCVAILAGDCWQGEYKPHSWTKSPRRAYVSFGWKRDNHQIFVCNTKGCKSLWIGYQEWITRTEFQFVTHRFGKNFCRKKHGVVTDPIEAYEAARAARFER